MKYLLALPVAALLMGCSTINVYENTGSVTVHQSKNVPIVAGKDIEDTGKVTPKVEPMAPEATFSTTDFQGRAAPLYINLPSKALDY